MGILGSVVGIVSGNNSYGSDISGIKGEQAAQSIRIAERRRQFAKEVDVFKRKSEMAYGDTVSSFAKAGVDLSESPLMVLNDQRNEFTKTMSDIKDTGNNEIRLMQLGQDALANKLSAARSARGSAMLGGMLDLFGTAVGSGAGG